MATPALTRFGSEELKQQFLAPAIAGDVLSCLGVSEVESGSDVASIKTTARPLKGNIIVHTHPPHFVSSSTQAQMIWWLTAARCGSLMGCKQTGCVSWPTQVKASLITTSHSSSSRWTARGLPETTSGRLATIVQIQLNCSLTMCMFLVRTSLARKAKASLTRCCSFRKRECGL